MKKRMLSLVLAVFMVITMLPMSNVFAGSGTGEFTVTGGELGTDYSYENNTLTISTDKALAISGTTTKDHIVVKSGVTANITLNGVDISSNSCAFEVLGTANITLAEGTTNILHSGENMAGLQVQTDATVIINGKGSLNATGGTFGAGIGGGADDAGGTITISDCTVTATGGHSGAGIGGGDHGAGGTITINSGTITATGVGYGAGIGGGDRGAGGTITINGGTVIATATSGSVGIGGGTEGAGGTITVSETMIVKGGDSSDDATVITGNYSNYPYIEIMPRPHTHCICGGSVNCGDHTSHSDIPYTPINNTDQFTDTNTNELDVVSIGNGNYYLTEDIVLTKSLKVESGVSVNLCLNGHKLDAKGEDLDLLSVSGELSICDCQGNGSITGVEVNAPAGKGDTHAIYIDHSGNLHLYSGSIAKNKTSEGGNVYNEEGTFVMYGGSIRDNSSKTFGGGLVNSGVFTMYGGSITENTAEQSSAGIFSLSDITLSGNVNISGNKVGTVDSNIGLAYENGGAGSTPTIPAIFIADPLTNTTSMGVSILELSEDNGTFLFTPKSGVFTSGGAINNTYLDKFKSDSSDYQVIVDGTQLKLAEKPYTPPTGSTGGGSSYKYYDIKITKEGNGIISPDGGRNNMVTIRGRRDQTFTFTPDKGYVVSDVLVDGKSIGAKASYTFQDVTKDHTLKVIFKTGSGHENLQKGVDFEDVMEKDWFYDSVANAVENVWFAGTSETTFSPHLSTTRGMIATVLWRMEQMPNSSPATIFEDVVKGQWYYDGVTWAQENDIVKGYGKGKFGPQDNITREQMAAILYRYAEFKGYDVSKTASLDSLNNGGTTSAYAKTPMAWAVANGLISGKGNGILDPKAGASRAEVAAILTRFDEIFTVK